MKKDVGTLRDGSSSSAISPSVLHFHRTIDALLTKDMITYNAHAMLKDLVKEKDSEFFNLVLAPTEVNDNQFRINHLDDILDAKINRELQQLYQEFSHEEAKSASLNYREENGLTGSSYVCGEVEFSSFSSLLASLRHNTRGIFIDVGSGTGRAVLTARLTCDYTKCIGIELLPSLHKLALSIKDRFNANLKNKLPPQSCQVQFVCADFTKVDWSNGDVVFAHSICFDDDLLNAMNEQAKELKKGSYFISFCSEGVDLGTFELIESTTYEMTWGEAKLFIYRRR